MSASRVLGRWADRAVRSSLPVCASFGCLRALSLTSFLPPGGQLGGKELVLLWAEHFPASERTCLFIIIVIVIVIIITLMGTEGTEATFPSAHCSFLRMHLGAEGSSRSLLLLQR